MQNYIDLILDNWFVALPLFLVLIWMLLFLIKKGYLSAMEFPGVKLRFNAVTKDESPSDSPHLKGYEITFTKTAADNIISLGITEEKVINLIGQEFAHHRSYYLYDIQDYPLPIQQDYIILLDKIGKSLKIRAVKSSNFNGTELASVNSLLSDYRRLSRYKYRTIKGYILRPATIKEIFKSHHEMAHDLIKHYILYKEPAYDSSRLLDIYLDYEYAMGEAKDPSEIAKYKKKAEESLPGNKAFAYNLISSTKALVEIERLTADLENGLISPDVADREIVLALERSLQYIHRTLNMLVAD